MNATPWGDRHGAPKPPDDIWDELTAAGKSRDDARIGAARAKYHAWLEQQGYPIPHQGKPPRADEAAR